jgi:biopolymer transport protein ExbD
MPTYTCYAVLLTLVLGVGCGGEKEKPQSPSQSENTQRGSIQGHPQQQQGSHSDEAANKLFDEAMQLIRHGSLAGPAFDTAGHYEKALDKIRKIVKEHPESDIGRKVMSNQKLFMGKSLAQFEGHVKEVRERERDVSVTLPTNSSGKTLSTAPKLIVINVKQDGSYKMGDKEMELDQIRIKLKEEVQKTPDQKVLVRGDGDALYKHVAAAVAAAKGAGVKEAHIGYKAEPNE